MLFSSPDIRPENLSERVVWYAIVGMYAYFFLGSVYIVGSVVGWILLCELIRLLWQQTDATPAEQKITIPWITWAWVIGMLVMELALIVGHVNFDLGLGDILKSSVGWAKGWALLAVFPLAGCLPIRPQLIYRAVCIVCQQTLLLLPLFLLAYLAHVPQILYVSPLQIVGGPSTRFFDVPLYEIDGTLGIARWRLFTPWAPALGLVGNLYFLLALQERVTKWKWFGLVGSVLMCIIPASRLAVVSLTQVLGITWVLLNWVRPWVMMGMGMVVFLAGLLSPMLAIAVENLVATFQGARPASTQVRQILGEIALERWWNEAPIWGHGAIEVGPKIVESMPIGSHHTWFGLLFIKGIVGFVALAIPMMLSLVALLMKSQKRPEARVGLSVLVTLFLYTFAENLEILAYLLWPGLLLLGIAFKDNQPLVNSSETALENA